MEVVVRLTLGLAIFVYFAVFLWILLGGGVAGSIIIVALALAIVFIIDAKIRPSRAATWQSVVTRFPAFGSSKKPRRMVRRVPRVSAQPAPAGAIDDDIPAIFSR